MGKKVYTPQADNDVIDIEIAEIKKKRFRFDKNDSRTVELNLADMGIIARLTDAYPKLQAQLESAKDMATDLSDGESDEDAFADMEKIGKKLTEIDGQMRELIDYIFDAPVSAVAAPDGSMYDVFEGQFRFEYIINLLLGYYSTNINDEFSRMRSHTEKYTKG